MASARAARWTEEVNLLHEEMRRTLRYFRSRVQHWTTRAIDGDAVLGPGFMAHASRYEHLTRVVFSSDILSSKAMHYRILLENASSVVLKHISADNWSLEQEDMRFANQSIRIDSDNLRQ